MSIQAVPTASVPQAPRGQEFRYESYRTDPATGELTCHYSVDGRRFTEQITFRPGADWDRPATAAAARLVFLLAGVSYYKTAAPPTIHTGDLALTRRERSFLRQFYLEGLGEFAYRNQLDLSGLRIEGPEAPAPSAPAAPASAPSAPASSPAPHQPHPAPTPHPPPKSHRPHPPHGARWSRSAAESTRSSPSNWSAPAPTSRCSW